MGIIVFGMCMVEVALVTTALTSYTQHPWTAIGLCIAALVLAHATGYAHATLEEG